LIGFSVSAISASGGNAAGFGTISPSRHGRIDTLYPQARASFAKAATVAGAPAPIIRALYDWAVAAAANNTKAITPILLRPLQCLNSFSRQREAINFL